MLHGSSGQLPADHKSLKVGIQGGQDEHSWLTQQATTNSHSSKTCHFWFVGWANSFGKSLKESSLKWYFSSGFSSWLCIFSLRLKNNIHLDTINKMTIESHFLLSVRVILGVWKISQELMRLVAGNRTVLPSHFQKMYYSACSWLLDFLSFDLNPSPDVHWSMVLAFAEILTSHSAVHDWCQTKEHIQWLPAWW